MTTGLSRLPEKLKTLKTLFHVPPADIFSRKKRAQIAEFPKHFANHLSSNGRHTEEVSFSLSLFRRLKAFTYSGVQVSLIHPAVASCGENQIKPERASESEDLIKIIFKEGEERVNMECWWDDLTLRLSPAPLCLAASHEQLCKCLSEFY
jgi:hypothetical protein